jgi:hypothetical protein
MWYEERSLVAAALAPIRKTPLNEERAASGDDLVPRRDEFDFAAWRKGKAQLIALAQGFSRAAFSRRAAASAAIGDKGARSFTCVGWL